MHSLDSLPSGKFVILFIPIQHHVYGSETIYYQAVTGMHSQHKGYVDVDGYSIRTRYGEPVGWLPLPTK